MEKTIKELLDEVMIAELLEFQSSEETSAEKKARVDYIAQLNKMQIDQEELERKYKYDFRDHVMDCVKIGVEVVAITLPVISYSRWIDRGMKFEETGTFTSNVFKGFFGKMKPTK